MAVASGGPVATDVPIKRAIVSLHDVAPPFEDAIRCQLEYLSHVGIDRCVLMVVPDWHGRHSILESSSLVNVLQQRVETGSQIVLHGVEHRPRGALGGTMQQRFRGAVFATDAAEFLTLDPAPAVEAVNHGLDVVEAAGLPRPDWFCAPGWLLRQDVRAALRRTGIEHAVNMCSVDDLETGARQFLPAIGSMGAAPGQELGVRLLNGIVRRSWACRAPVLQVYIHPQRGAAAWRNAVDNVAEMVRGGGYRPATYAEVFDGRDV